MARKRRMESNLQNRPTQQRENRHRPVTPEQVAEYTNIPLATIYQKLANKKLATRTYAGWPLGGAGPFRAKSGPVRGTDGTRRACCTSPRSTGSALRLSRKPASRKATR